MLPHLTRRNFNFARHRAAAYHRDLLLFSLTKVRTGTYVRIVHVSASFSLVSARTPFEHQIATVIPVMFCKVNIMALGGLEAADAPKNEKMAALPSFAQCTRVLPCALSSLEFILCWPLAAWRSFDVTHHTHPVYRQNDENPRLFVYAHRPSQATGRKRWYPCSSPARGSRDSRDPSFASCPGTPTALPPTSAPRSPRSAFAPRVSTPETGRWAVVSCRNPCPAPFLSLSLGSCWGDWCCSEALKLF